MEKQQQAVDEFKIQHEREKKEALAAFEEYKSKVKARESALKSECEDKVNKAATTLETMKTEFKKRVDDFNAAVKKMEAQGGSQVQEIAVGEGARGGMGGWLRTQRSVRICSRVE